MIFVLDMLIAASVAWFAMRRDTEAAEMGMGLDIIDSSADYNAFMYDIENEKGTNKHPKGGDLLVTNLDLNQYDTIFKAQNVYTPAFAQIKIKATETTDRDGTLLITITREMPTVEDDEEENGEENGEESGEESGEEGEELETETESQEGKLDMYSSSVIRFTAFVDPSRDESDEEITDPDALYKHISTEKRFEAVEDYKGNERDDSKTFVLVIGEGEGHTHDKVDSITLAVPYTSSDWYPDSEGNDILIAYLYITYDVQLIECFMSENTSGGISLDDNVYYFKNDMKRITISYAD